MGDLVASLLLQGIVGKKCLGMFLKSDDYKGALVRVIMTARLTELFGNFFVMIGFPSSLSLPS